MTEGARERWLFDDEHPPLAEVDGAIAAHYLVDEATTVRELAARATLDPSLAARVQANARELVVAIRAGQRKAGGVDALLGEYDLSSREGVVLMCLAEALLRIPDAATADQLIADKLAARRLARASRRESDSLFVNASTWALMLTGRVLRAADVAEDTGDVPHARSSSALGEPVVRAALRQAMRILGAAVRHGRDHRRGAARAPRARRELPPIRSTCSARRRSRARTRARYLDAYARRDRSDRHARPRPRIVSRARHLGQAVGAASALRVRAARPRACASSSPRAARARARARERRTSALTIDAEEADRLELSLAIFARVLSRCRARRLGRARARGAGLPEARAARARLARRRSRAARAGASRCASSRARTGTPRSSARRSSASPAIRCSRARRNTDVSYLACARDLLDARRRASIRSSRRTTRTRSPGSLEVGARREPFEFQRLHGMGEALYASVARASPVPSVAAASTRRSAATSTCCRISCGDCSRTARTRRSSIASCDADARRSTSRRRPARGDARSSATSRTRAIPLPRDLFAPRAPQFARHRISRTAGELVRARRRARGDESRHVARRAAHRRQRARAARAHAMRNPADAVTRSSARCDWRGCEDRARGARGGRRIRSPFGMRRRARERARNVCATRAAAVRALDGGARGALRRGGRPDRCKTALAEVREAVDFLPLLRGTVRAAVRGAGAAARANRRAQRLRSSAAAFSSASARGIFRSRSSPARSRRARRRQRGHREAGRATLARRAR